MKIKPNRRDLLRFGGGAAAGLLLTPVPWKLLDDSSIWTQNWSWTPRLPTGPATERFTSCTLCPAGCGVKARCIAGVPVSLAGAAGHPASAGVLCPVGLTGHHLAYRAGRARQFSGRGKQAGLADIQQALHPKSGMTAILDGRPGRAVSQVYRRFAASLPQGRYLAPPAPDAATFTALRRLMREPSGPYGLDLEHTKTLLSFGAPMLEDWGTPGRVWAARPGFRLWQAESRYSRTGELADVRLAIRPGSEGALALAMAHVILRDNLADAGAAGAIDFATYRKLVETFTPEAASQATGLAPELIESTARGFAAGPPAVALSGGDVTDPAARIAIAGLNLLVGSVGRTGGLVARREEQEEARGIESVPDGAIAALIVDATEPLDTLPWAQVRRKLAPDAKVVCLTPFASGIAQNADYLVAVPGHLEALKDIPTPFDSPAATFSLSVPLLPPPPGTMEAGEFVGNLAKANPGSVADTLRQRVAQIHASRRGTLHPYDGSAPAAMEEIASAEDLWKSLHEGACWVDERGPEKSPRRFSLLGGLDDGVERLLRPAPGPVAQASTPAPFGRRWTAGSWPVSPLWRV